MKSNPTAVAYAELLQAYDLFNECLFDGQLPGCLITLQRKKATCGYFSPKRFGNHAKETRHEIAMNPEYFAAMPLVEVMQTLVHEMTHLWQYEFGEPGRCRYHNAEWANKMQEVGLMPSSTGQPGGKTTGDHMGDYAIVGGLFLTVFSELTAGSFKISWYDRFPPADSLQAGQSSFAATLNLPNDGSSIPALSGLEIAPTAINAGNKSNRSKYTCGCGNNVWGKPGLEIMCGDCDEAFTEG